ncbi:MAG TPA: hypothetical protein VF868_16475 [Bacteroidia bacterium]|jgi:UDP-N-acetylmuramoylalanine--D-glutamate ligase
MSENNKIQNNKVKPGRSALANERVRTSDDDHHMEFVDAVNGIAYINDSGSVRLSATRNSIEAIETSVVLVTGGDDHGNDYSLLRKVIKEKVVGVIYLGNSSDLFLKHFSSQEMFFAKAENINEAVMIADAFSRSGDVVLFSPACSGCSGSDNYKVRGNRFKAAVKNLRG